MKIFVRAFFLSLALVFIVLSGMAANDAKIPQLIGRVNDYAQVLSAAERKNLEWALAQDEEKTSHQVAVLTMPTIGTANLVDFSQAVYSSWKLGQKGVDNGVLIVLVKDRIKTSLPPTRIHPGRGLEGTLPDVLCGRIATEMNPLLLQGKYNTGLELGLSRVLRAVDKEVVPTHSRDEAAGTVLVGVLGLLGLTLVLGGFIGWLGKRLKKEAKAEYQAFWDALPPREPTPAGRVHRQKPHMMRKSPPAVTSFSRATNPPSDENSDAIAAAAVAGSVVLAASLSNSELTESEPDVKPAATPVNDPDPPPFVPGGGEAAGAGGEG